LRQFPEPEKTQPKEAHPAGGYFSQVVETTREFIFYPHLPQGPILLLFLYLATGSNPVFQKG
jgi:hypothetical protein